MDGHSDKTQIGNSNANSSSRSASSSRSSSTSPAATPLKVHTRSTAASPRSSAASPNHHSSTPSSPSSSHSTPIITQALRRYRVAAQDMTTAGAAAAAVAAAAVAGINININASSATAALDMKSKTAAATAAAAVELMRHGTSASQSQKIKKLVRRNASDKLRLIQMVHDNPILWDSRLPNFKGAEEEKNRAWELIGKEFNAPGRRVARAFKSLRESYRRELAHVKLMGNGFKPKWSLYEAMDFLRDVIRERKGGSHAVEPPGIGLNLSAFSQHLNNNNNNDNKSSLKLNALHSSFNETAALNLSKCGPALNMSHEDYYYFVKPELDMPVAAAAAAAAAALAAHANSNGVPHPIPAHQSQPRLAHNSNSHSHAQSLPQSTAIDSRVSSTRNDSTTQHSANFDDLDASSMRSGDEASVRNNTAMSNQGSDEVEELEAIDADFPYPLILDSNSERCVSAGGGGGGGGGSAQLKRKRRDMNGGDSGEGGPMDDDDDYEGQMLMQHRHLRQQNGVGGGGSSGAGGIGCMMDMAPPQTVREVLNSKFCGFISAKLNSMEDTEADNLMNKILMLLVQTQGNEPK